MVIDKHDAPPGYVAILAAPQRPQCTGCAFNLTTDCPWDEARSGYFCEDRNDGQNVIFIKE